MVNQEHHDPNLFLLNLRHATRMEPVNRARRWTRHSVPTGQDASRPVLHVGILRIASGMPSLSTSPPLRKVRPPMLVNRRGVIPCADCRSTSWMGGELRCWPKYESRTVFARPFVLVVSTTGWKPVGPPRHVSEALAGHGSPLSGCSCWAAKLPTLRSPRGGAAGCQDTGLRGCALHPGHLADRIARSARPH